jgi:hypothetical protein
MYDYPALLTIKNLSFAGTCHGTMTKVLKVLRHLLQFAASLQLFLRKLTRRRMSAQTHARLRLLGVFADELDSPKTL